MNKYSYEEMIDVYKLNIKLDENRLDYEDFPTYSAVYLEEVMNKVQSNEVSYDDFLDYLLDMTFFICKTEEEIYLNESGFIFYCREKLGNKENFSEIYDLIKLHNEEKKLIVYKRHLSDVEKMAYVDYFGESYRTNRQEFDVEFYAECLEDLVSKNNLLATEIKAYLHYGNCGNKYGYECNYKNCEELLLKLLDNEKVGDEDKGRYANTLGYIYYYGRVNDGIKEYEKAFKYYSFASACGFYEATFKLSDMYKYGLGVTKSNLASYGLVHSIYADLREKFCSGNFGCEFADVCIRMGNFYRDGIYVEQNDYAAYSEYLVARFALSLRIDVNDFFGDYKLKERVDKDVALLEEKLQIKKYRKTIYISLYSLVNVLEKDFTIKFKEMKDKYKITFTKLNSEREILTFDGYNNIFFSNEFVFYVEKNENNKVLFNNDVNNVCRSVDHHFNFKNDDNQTILSLYVDRIMFKF